MTRNVFYNQQSQQDMMKFILLLLCPVVHSLDSNQAIQEISDIITKYETQSHISNYNLHLTNSRLKRLRQSKITHQTQTTQTTQTQKYRKPQKKYLRGSRGSSNRAIGRYTTFVNHSGKSGFTSY